MKRLNVTFITRLVSGSFIRLIMLVIYIALLPILLMSFVAGNESLGLLIGLLILYVPFTAVFAYSYSKLGVFTDSQNIIERTLFNKNSIKISNIGNINLDMLNGARYSTVVISLIDKSIDSNYPKDLEKATFFKILTYKSKNVFDLKTTQLQLRKKNAWKFANSLIRVIRENGNTTATVILPSEPEEKGLLVSYERQAYRFWNGFREN